MTALAHKLGLRDGLTYGVVRGGYSGFPDVQADLELGAPTEQWADADMVLWPATTEADVRAIFDQHSTDIVKINAVWICYKKNNGAPINRDKIWDIALEYRWKVVAQVSLNDTWSALRVRTNS